ncbi:MAG: PP2C family protein-serine/threonine phosphatase [Bacteroidota bacterium]
MNQHKLYRTIEMMGDRKVRTDDQLLTHILKEIISSEEIPVRGGRIWKLEPTAGTYKLIHQEGEIEPIKKSFRLRIPDYPMFMQLPRKGTIVATETDKYLRQRGIKLYSATGVGEKVQWKGYALYPYVIAINADYLKNDMMYALNIIGQALTTALRNRKIESKARLLQQDLDKAREIQKSILPDHELRFHTYDLYGVSLPDRIVGGDFFDYLHASDDKDRLAVVIGDAASKGLSAAAQALYVSGALRMGVEYQTKMGTLIGRINRLVNMAFTAEHFVSMVYAEINNAEKGLVFYINAGHNNPILLRGKTEEVELLPATGQIIGPFPNERYKTEFAIMNKGDILLLYTDGITEASNENHEMYGEKRLIAKLKELKDRTPKEICQNILEDVLVHNRLIEFSDDKTLVVLKRSR